MWLTWLASAATLTGYPVVEIGAWRSHGHGEMASCEGVVGHHTGTDEDKLTGDYPSLGVVRDGRTGLKGPLSHLGLGRSGKIYVIAAGACYHAGVSAYAGMNGLNDKFIGIEAEDEGDGDWTREQRDCYPKLVGALLYTMKRGPNRYVSHRSCALPHGRKSDPAGLSDEWMRDNALAFMNTLMKPTPPIGPTPGTEGPTSLLTLRQGDQNATVMALHVWMTRKYQWAREMFSPTGFYGPFTVKAVKEFQARMGITGPSADGTIIGPATKAALWAEGFRGVA